MTTSIWRESSDSLHELFAALSKCAGQLRNAPNNKANHFAKKDKQGQPIPNYADLATVLDTIRPVLAVNGLSVTQVFHPQSDDVLMLVTTIGHSSGQFQRSYLPLKANLAPQQLVAASTYLKRVALSSMLGISSEHDDDGEIVQQAAEASSGQEAEAIESRAMKALAVATDAEAKNAIMTKAQLYVTTGLLSPAALLRLQSARQTLDEQAKAAADSEAATSERLAAVQSAKAASAKAATPAPAKPNAARGMAGAAS